MNNILPVSIALFLSTSHLEPDPVSADERLKGVVESPVEGKALLG